MTRFLAFVIKEFRHLWRDPRSILILVFIPIIQLLLFGYVVTTEINSAKIGVLDQSHDEISHELTQKLISSGYFQLAAELHQPSEIDELFKRGHIKEVVVFEPDFALHLEKENVAHMQIITDASDPNSASLLTNYTQHIVMDYLGEVNERYHLKVPIETPYRMFYNEDLRSSASFVPGTMAMILMLISALMTSISIAREKEMGTMEVLLVSPLKPIQIVLGKVVPYFGLSVVNMILILTLGHTVFKVPIEGSLVLLVASGLLFMLVALALGVLISIVSDSQQTAMIISLIGLMLPTILLSGFIFPLENMPKVLQGISLIMPARWFLAAIKAIMLKGAGFGLVWKELSILAVMCIALLTISASKFKIRLE